MWNDWRKLKESLSLQVLVAALQFVKENFLDKIFNFKLFISTDCAPFCFFLEEN